MSFYHLWFIIFTYVYTVASPIFSTAPTSQPQTVLVSAQDSRAVFISWESPPPEEQNGIIREYRINVTEVNTGTMWQLVSTTNSKVVSTLHPNYVYEFEVTAFTIGTGPYSAAFSVTTPEDGKSIFFMY